MSTLWIRHSTDGAAVARHNIRSALIEGGLTADDAYEAALIASELVANAVRHGAALPSGHLAVEWSLDDEGYLISVTDGGSSGALDSPAEPTQPANGHRPGAPKISPRQADPADVTGRGLTIVAALATSWGVANRADSTTVWARGVPQSSLQPSN